jgi:hypothetical protein
MRRSFCKSGSCRGGREFETTEFNRHGVATHLNNYINTNQDNKLF